MEEEPIYEDKNYMVRIVIATGVVYSEEVTVSGNMIETIAHGMKVMGKKDISETKIAHELAEERVQSMVKKFEAQGKFPWVSIERVWED